jgi:hypothetical protein
VNEDGKYTDLNDQKPVFIGQNFFGGLNNSFSYKGFQLDIFCQFVKQQGYTFISLVIPGQFSAFSGSNQLRSLIDETMNGKSQKYTSTFSSEAGSAMGIYSSSDGQIQDASFIRLKNVSLSWTLPAKYQKALHLKNSRLYLQGQNLLTLTNYEGFDPEASFNSSANAQLRVPPLRMITAGIQVSL